MSTTLRKMDTQLKTWLARIDRMAARTATPDSPADAVPAGRITELRSLHATALKEFTVFRAADAEERANLVYPARIHLPQGFDRGLLPGTAVDIHLPKAP